MHNFEVEGL